MRLYVGGLSNCDATTWQSQQQDLLRRLASFGRVETKTLPPLQTRTGYSWYTFVEVGDDTSFAYAKCKGVLHGTRWKGGQIQLDKAKPDYTVRLNAEREERAAVRERQKLGPKRRRKAEAAIAKISRSTAEVKSGPSALMPELKPSESAFKWHRGKNPKVLNPVLKLRKSKTSPLFTFDPVKSIAGHLYFGAEEDNIADDIEGAQPSTIFDSVDYVAPEPDLRIFSSRLAKRVRPDIDVSRVPSSYCAYDDLSFVPIDESDADEEDEDEQSTEETRAEVQVEEEEEEEESDDPGVVEFGDDDDDGDHDDAVAVVVCPKDGDPFAGFDDGFFTGGDRASDDDDDDDSSSGSAGGDDSNSGGSDSDKGDFQDSASDDDNNGGSDDDGDDGDDDDDDDDEQEDASDDNDEDDEDENDDDDDSDEEGGKRRKGLERKVLMEMFSSDDSSDGEVFGVVDIEDGDDEKKKKAGKQSTAEQKDAESSTFEVAEDPWKEGFDEADPGLLDAAAEVQTQPSGSRAATRSTSSSLDPKRNILMVPDVIPQQLRDEPIFCRTTTKRAITAKWEETRPALNRRLKSTAQRQKKHK